MALHESPFAMRLHVWFALSLIMAMASIVSVFIFIPVVSAYAFWMAVGAYIILASSLKWWFWRAIEAAKAAWTRIKKNTALTFEDFVLRKSRLVAPFDLLELNSGSIDCHGSSGGRLAWRRAD